MSFSGEQKKYIISQQYKSLCCKKSLFQGVLFSKGSLHCDNRIIISVEKSDTADFISALIHDIYGTFPEKMHFDVGGRRLGLSFKSSSAAKYLANINVDNEYFQNKCSFCSSSFLKGIFLGCGRISDPQKQYSLEFSPSGRADLLCNFLCNFGLNAAISNKKKEMIVYLKNIGDIEDFFGFAGLNKAMFIFMDAKVEGELRKNAMRVANCETNNIAKTVVAATRQLEIIRALDKANLLSNLPDELEETARLRMLYEDLSLSQLAAISVPPISKPGLSHRLKKIIEIGEHLLGQKENK